MNNRPTILFTSTFTTPFIESDLRILRSRYPVTRVTGTGVAGLLRTIAALHSRDISFSWFASVYSSSLIIAAKLSGKRSVVVIGGVDLAKMPEYRYGIWNSPWKSFLVARGLRNASVVIAVDESLKQEAMTRARYDGRNIVVLPTGFDGKRFQPAATKEKKVLCVARCDDDIRWKIKGIDFLFDIAAKLPGVPFTIIGISQQVARGKKIPPNVTMHATVPQEDLLQEYSRAAVYLQPSLREGLPNALCEAMLSGCIPVGTRTGGIPVAIGETGMTIEYGDTSGATDAVTAALTRAGSEAPRERILRNYSIEKREQGLFELIDSLSHG